MIISHTGTIDAITENQVKVRITSQSACAGCHAKGACGGLDEQEKTINVIHDNPESFTVGQDVVVSITEKIGFMALFWGYLAPFLLVFTTLIAVYLMTSKQELAGLCSLAILIPYYGALYLLRAKLSKIFLFEIN